MRLVWMATAILLVAACTFAEGKNLMLAENGKTNYVIVLAQDAIAPEKTAARELQKYLQMVTGADFQLLDPLAVQKDHLKIYVGPSEAARELVPQIDSAELGTDGIVIKTVGRDLVLAGGRPRGTLYAVYTFLQDVVGCRWYADAVPTAADALELVPNQPTLTISAQNVVYRPPFDLRHAYTQAFGHSSSTRRDPLFMPKNRQNPPEVPQEYGGGISYGGAHTMTSWVLPPKEFFDRHPEWYSYRVKDAKRKPEQLCMTNEQARQKAADRVLHRLDQVYADWEYGPKIISISPADSNKFCQCDECLSVVKREGSDSGPLIEFVNYVAERVERKYPDVIVSTLAYLGTDRPPQHVKPRKNVLIHFAALDRNHKLPISQVENFSRWLGDWSLMAEHVYAWDYDAHFANFIQPHPNHFVLAQSLRFYRDNGVSGVFYQGNHGNASEFTRMRGWVNAQLMWNPDRDERALAKEFLNAYYDGAGAYLMAYIDLIGSAIQRQPGLWLGTFNADTRHWLTLDDLNAATKLFDQAAKAVEADEKFSWRVARARLSIDIVWLQRYRQLRREAKKQDLPFLGPEDPYAEVERISRDEFNVGSYAEWRTFDAYISFLHDLFPARTGNTPVECQGLKPYEWVEIQENQLTATLAVSRGEQAKTVDDPKASNGRAMLLTGNVISFSPPYFQADYKLPAVESGGRTKAATHLAGRYRVYAVVRAVPLGDLPAAIALGIYDSEEFYRAVVEFSAADSGEYRTIDLGVHQLTEGAKIWVQPNGAGTYGQINATFVDRLFLIAAE